MPGPDKETLRQLAGMLPSVIEHAENKRILKTGSRSLSHPHRVCVICLKTFDFKRVAPEKIERSVCEICNISLVEGYTAIICDDKYAFVRSEALADLAGKIVSVTGPQMARIEEKHQLQLKRRELTANIIPLFEDDAGAVQPEEPPKQDDAPPSQTQSPE